MSSSKNTFIILMAFLMSLVALTIDAMLPALGHIKESLGVANGNDIQLIISTVFLGMALGLILYGPISDSWGRKKTLNLGIVIYLFGCLISIFSENLQVMLMGRFFQGFGAAACRVVTVAMIRDRFSGVEMGKVMSLIMMFFVIVPALAPTLGQIVLYFFEWQAIFFVFIILGLLGILLLRFKQEETLKVENRIPFTAKSILKGAKETLSHSETRGYTISAGFIFGGFIGYLSSAQQIFQVQYQLGDKFSYYFGGLALCIGISSFLNSKLLERFSMKSLVKTALMTLACLSAIYLLILYIMNGTTPLFGFLLYLGLSFLSVGLLFSNLSTLAIEPLGHIAGVANSIISSFQTFLSVLIGGFIGQMYSGNLYPLVISFLILSLLSLLTIKLTTKP